MFYRDNNNGLSILRKNPYRNLIPGVDIKVPIDNGTHITAVNFDNAATTPAFLSVIKEVNEFMPWYSSIHRGKGFKSMFSTQKYEECRNLIKQFLNASDDDVVIYTKNTTDAINILSYTLSQQKGVKDIILSTWMEHAANDLPWRDKFNVMYVEIDKYGRLMIDDLEDKLKEYGDRVKLVTVAGTSNVTGYVNDIHQIARLAHKYNTQIHVDGAQMVPHMKVDMMTSETPEHIDFISFSAHKMYAPYGAGALVGPKTTFESGLPYCQGGSAIELITHKQIKWEEPPARDEAGSPNLIGVIAMMATIKQLNKIGMDNAFNIEKQLFEYTFEKMKSIPDITIYNHPDKEETIGVIPFNMEGVHHRFMSAILSYEAGIAVRNGFFCSHPYCERLLGYSEDDMDYFFKNPDALFPGMVRVSLGIYNNLNEIDRLIYWLHKITNNKKYYIDKYSNSRGLYDIKNEV